MNASGDSSAPYTPTNVFPDLGQHLRVPNDCEDIDMDGNSDAASFATADDDRTDPMDLDDSDIYCDDPKFKQAEPGVTNKGNSDTKSYTVPGEPPEHPKRTSTPTPHVTENPTKRPKANIKPFVPPVLEEKDLDLSTSIRGMYRILDLVKERGSGGLGDLPPSMDCVCEAYSF
jgi:hypothetical protein